MTESDNNRLNVTDEKEQLLFAAKLNVLNIHIYNLQMSAGMSAGTLAHSRLNGTLFFIGTTTGVTVQLSQVAQSCENMQ